MVFAGWLVFFAKGYALAGCIVAAAFVLFGIDRVDASSRGAYSFRPLIMRTAVQKSSTVAAA